MNGPSKPIERSTWCALSLTLTLAACATPIGVRHAGFGPIFEARTASILSGPVLSDRSRQLLAALGLEAMYADDPSAVIDAIRANSLVGGRRSVFSLLAEMHYARALELDSAAEFLVAAIMAYHYLFATDLQPPPSAFDPSYRLTCDIYNRALAQALIDESGNARLDDRTYETSLGAVTVTAAPSDFPWTPSGFTRFLPADAYEVRGLRERVRTSGLGVPLIAVRDSKAIQDETATRHLGLQTHLPATAVLEVHGGIEALRAQRIQATVRLHLTSRTEQTTLGGNVVPLESDQTAPLAYTLEGSRIWDFSITGFLRRPDRFEPGLYFMHPYERGKIPLVFVHGTASNPATWAQMLNGLRLDGDLRQNYQIWLALYPTGSPILANAAEIRTALAAIVAELDPDGTDAALDRMVIAGHSQGGLLTRLLVSSSGNRIWSMVTDLPLDRFETDTAQRERLRRTVFFEPLPFVERAVFIATPHRGSFIANSIFGWFAHRLVTLPDHIVQFSRRLDRRNADGAEENLPTSVDNMKEGSHFVQLVAELPFAPDIHLNSIVAVDGDGPAEEGDDGVVRYRSAHLPQAESELVVRSSHSCQNDPTAIFELRRILRQHLQTAPRPGPGPRVKTNRP
jgi:pimeloyl-ACP methyl ester carboxylesterase